jgi:Cytotoxic translational repressor of toxin-antitoxin stability system
VKIEYTDAFKRQLRKLARRYRHIRQDLNPLIDQLQKGVATGYKITGLGYPLYKVRLRNRDIQSGKSGGYRVIYYLQSRDKIILVTIYSKNDQADIRSAEIRRIIGSFENLR